MILRSVLAISAALLWCGGAAAQVPRGNAPSVSPLVVGDVPSLSIPPLSDVQRSAALQRVLGRSDVVAVGTPVSLTPQRPWDAASQAALGTRGITYWWPENNVIEFHPNITTVGRSLILIRLPTWANGYTLVDCAVSGPQLTSMSWFLSKNSGATPNIAEVTNGHVVFVVTGNNAREYLYIESRSEPNWFLQGCELRRVQ